MKIIGMTKTCDVCPSQWEANLDDGRMLYIRYRWGHLTVNISPSPTKDVMDAVDGPSLFSESIGDDYDGFLSEDELMAAVMPKLAEWKG